MRDYKKEFDMRVAYIRGLLKDSRANGIVYGNSGGKDSALVGILCKAACENTVGIIMPCNSKRNFTIDLEDGKEVAQQFRIETRVIDLTAQRELAVNNLDAITSLSSAAVSNIAPRLRMITLYAVAASENRMVAGTGNLSERYMGYFTKWGDGACDFNPISDLTVTEVFEFLRYLNAPNSIVEKAPSAGLYEGQTDEEEMGVTYRAIDHYIETGIADARDLKIIEGYHKRSEHKRKGVSFFAE
jgi:NAD+ synthase